MFMVVFASVPVGVTEILGICLIAVADSIEPDLHAQHKDGGLPR